MRHLSWSTLLAAALIVLPAASIQGADGWPATAQQSPTAPGPRHETRIVLGESPPTSFELRSIDDERFDLAAAEGPILLLFFRGTW